MKDMICGFLADQEKSCKLVLRQNIALSIIDFNDVRHVTRVNVNGFTRELRDSCCSTVIGVEEVPYVRIDGSIINVNT